MNDKHNDDHDDDDDDEDDDAKTRVLKQQMKIQNSCCLYYVFTCLLN